MRLQKQKEIVEEQSTPIESVEDPTPQKTEDANYVWKPTGEGPVFTVLTVRSLLGTWSHAFVHPRH